MLPSTAHDALPASARAIQGYDRREFEILLGEVHAMLDRIADCWRPDMSANAVAVAGITSEVVRSNAGADPDVTDATVLDSLRTEIGHILTSRRNANRDN